MGNYLTLAKPELIVSNYYTTVFALTPKDTVSETRQDEAGQTGVPLPSSPSWLIYAPFLIFFVLFAAAFGLLMYNRVWNAKRILLSFFIAVTFAAIPYVTGTIRNGIGSQTNAGPDEIPRNVKVIKHDANSILVTWETDADKIGAVRFGLIPFNVNQTTVIMDGTGIRKKQHSIMIDIIKPGSYGLEIFSGNRWYDQNGTPLEFNFK
jgi:hypothetical protein